MVAQIHDALQQAGFDGSYSTVYHHARRWERGAAPSKVYVPPSFRPVEGNLFDWSTEHFLVDGNSSKVQVVHMKLYFNRQGFARAYQREIFEMVFDAHNRALGWFGGSSERGIYDSMSAVVSQVLRGFNVHDPQLLVEYASAANPAREVKFASMDSRLCGVILISRVI